MRQHDVILFGATGFTGRLVAQYLAGRSGLSPDRWAMAGRDTRRLAAIRERLAARDERLSEVAIYQADVADHESLSDVAVRTTALATTVGPYERHGRPVAKACLDAGTHYLDLTGEPGFWRDLVSAHHDEATERGVLMVPCCGFDSIPHDLAAWMAVRALDPASQGRLEVDGYVAARGRPSGGTWSSALGILADSTPAQLGLSLGGGSEGGSGGNSSAVRRRRVHFEQDVRRWVLPLPTIDPMVIKRSAVLAREIYGEDFEYRHWLETKSPMHAAQLVAGVGALATVAKSRTVRRLLRGLKPSGSGPSEEEREKSWFRVKAVARRGEARAVAIVSGGDPGYDETSKMLAEATLCLALDRDRLPLRGGVATPASAMGQVLVERLRAAGLKLSVTEPEGWEDAPGKPAGPAAARSS